MPWHKQRLLLLPVIAMAFCFGANGCGQATKNNGVSAPETWRPEPIQAIAILPDPPCVAMTAEQRRRSEVVLSVLQTLPRHEQVYGGAIGYFGNAQDLGTNAPFCLDRQMEQSLVEATLHSRVWDYGMPGVSRLALARRLGPRAQPIIDDVAKAAFAPTPLADGAFSDIRPMARSILASYGVAASPWREQALKAMTATDALGTSAAQVAGASRDPEAVNAVADLLRRSLVEYPTGPIPNERAKRLVELAYAIGAAGEAGRPHLDLLSDLLERDVESFAPPFGMIERAPSEVCWAIDMVTGPEADRLLSNPRCRKPWFRMPG